MITLYTWLPTAPSAVIEHGIPPDIGHSSLFVEHDDGAETYISFWPEMEGLVGRLTYSFKPRTIRNAVSLEQESDPNGPYMQRPPDFSDSADGLDEDRMVAAWQSMLDLPYDLKRWNCSNVTRLLLLIAIDPRQLGPVLKASEFNIESLQAENPEGFFPAVMLEFAAMALFDCNPSDVRRLVKVLRHVNGGAKDAETSENLKIPAVENLALSNVLATESG
ncbi:MAG TPA: hypothetical protein VGK19_10410 [Capsulimonadaceae bacterium]|jgi:hypothetical protein